MRSGFAGADLETLAGLTVAGGAQRQQAGRRQERIHAILEAPGAEQPHWILLRRRRGWSKRRARPADAHSEISGSANDAGVAARSRIHGVAPAHHLMMVVEAPRRRRRRQKSIPAAAIPRLREFRHSAVVADVVVGVVVFACRSGQVVVGRHALRRMQQQERRRRWSFRRRRRRRSHGSPGAQ